MIILAAIVITFVLLLAITASAIAVGNRAIAVQIERDLQEALECIAIARRVHLRRRHTV